LPNGFFSFPLRGLVGSHTIRSHTQRRHMNKTPDTVAPGRFHYMARPQVMNPLEGRAAILHNNSNQMDDSVTSRQPFIESRVLNHVALDQFNALPRQTCGFIHIAHQRADGVSLRQQSLQQMTADKTRNSSEEDLHALNFKLSNEFLSAGRPVFLPSSTNEHPGTATVFAD
jgi:hypothetical protein